jgi:cardiolipin synthase
VSWPSRNFAVALLLALTSISGCTWPVLRALPIIGESYESPRWENSSAISDPAFRQTLERALGTSFTEGNKVTTYINGDEIFPSIFESIRNASRYIYLESYIVWNGEVAQHLADALAERAQCGVRVEAVFDWHGSQDVSRKLVKLLKNSGVQLKFYHPLKWFDPRGWRDFGDVDNRSHRRILVIDGKVAFTGGAGFADVWRGDAHNRDEWRDNHYKIEGPAVQFIAGVFSENWWSTKGKYSFDPAVPPEPTSGTSAVQVARSSPGTAIPAGIVTFSAAIEASRKNIRISTPYFVPEDELLKQLAEAAKRGVKVEVIVPGKNSDNPVVRTASRGMWGALLKAGGIVYEFEPSLYHCKVLIVDDEFVTIGTSNWDARSLRLNDEIIVNILDPSFTKTQIEIIEADKLRSKPVNYEEWRQRPIWERFIDAISGSTKDEL